MQPLFLPPDSGDVVTVMGIRHRVVVTGKESGGACTLLELSSPPGAGIPAHVHTHEDEVFHVVEGSAEFQIGGETVEARAGATVVGPRGKPHAYRVSGKTACRMLVVVTPGGIERFLRELRDAGAAEPEAIAEIAGRHGIAFTP